MDFELRILNLFASLQLHALGCCPFSGGGSVVVDILLNVIPIVCGSSVFVFILLGIVLCPF